MKKIAVFLALSIFIISCEDKFSVVHSGSIAAKDSITRNDTIIRDSLENVFFSRLSKKGSFGIIYTYFPSEEIREKPIEIIISGNARTNSPFSNASIVVTVGSKSNKQQLWTGKNLRYFFTDINTWCRFDEKVTIHHENWQEDYYRIDVFAYLPGPTSEYFDIDSLNVKIKVKQK